jgi:hypothetical protein
MSNDILPVPNRPTWQGVPGRRYIGPKAQTAVHEAFYDRIAIEATDRRVPLTDVWREVIYAGLLRTGRASRAEVKEACSIVGIDPSTLFGAA